MQVLAFSVFVWAAFDWPAPWLDRVGLAALGLGLLALALSAPPIAVRRPAFLSPDPRTVELDDPDEDELDDLPTRVGRYTSTGAAGL